jgi:hypothetical protein
MYFNWNRSISLTMLMSAWFRCVEMRWPPKV